MLDILLVDDHNIVRDGIKSLLLTEPGFQVVGHARNGREAFEKINDGLKVSLVLTDINMPEIDGFGLIKLLKDEYPEIKVVILSMLTDENYIQQAFAQGAKGYLVKVVGLDELIFALKHVAAGNFYLSSHLTMTLLEKNSSFYSINSSATAAANLSERETQVLKMVALGLTNIEIAEKLFTSKRTVEGHRQKLLNKTGTKNTAALIRYAIQHKILS